MIDQYKDEFELNLLCEVLKVSRQGYYVWKDRQASAPSATAQRREALLEEIRQIHDDSHGSYGSPRIYAELQDRQIDCCVNTVAKLMKDNEIRARVRKRFVPRTTDSAHDQPVFENLLEQEFTAELPNQKWVCDITYIPTEEGFLYLGSRDGFVQQKDRWLADGRSFADRIMHRCPDDGDPEPQTAGGIAASF